MQTDVLIIGAGLSGLAIAARLEAAGRDYLVVEARGRAGGRILGKDGLDLGPSWIWPRYQPRISRMIDRLALRTHVQFETDHILHETEGGIQALAYPRRYQDAARLAGGPSALIHHLTAVIPGTKIRLRADVEALDYSGDVLARLKDGRGVKARQVVIAVPPPLVANWNHTPALPDALRTALTRWPTWMAPHAKISLRYAQPFWRTNGLSGAAISQVGPLMEIVDHSDDEAGTFGLSGFFGWPANVRAGNADQLETQVLDQLTRLFGDEARQPLALHFKDWARDLHTATPQDLGAAGGHPPYGDPAFAQGWMEGRLMFAGAETAAEHGGLIEGALAAAERAVDFLNRRPSG
jgi:monoamine oxidase